MLTNAAVKAARPKARAYKIFDERGLFLYVAPTGLRAWRMKYRVTGREKLLSLGHWPGVTLDQARDLVGTAHERLGRGEDPGSRECKSASSAGQICTVASVARGWHVDRRSGWSDRHAADVLASLERDVFPMIGDRPIGEIEAAELLDVIQSIEARGAHETARRVRQRLDMIFSYAAVRKFVTANPAAMIARELQAAPAQQRQPALLDIDQARDLLEAAGRAARSETVGFASQFLALTAVRMNALRAAAWNEFEDLDGDAPLWRVPAAHMKLRKVNKADPANDHLVPLSPAAARILRTMRENGYDTRSTLVFAISADAIGALYNRIGYRGRHTPHGWRATFSTILNEHFPEEQAVIDRALGHAGLGKVEKAYNRAQQLQRRRELYDRWASLLAGSRST